MLRIYRLPITVTEDCIDVLGHTNNKEYLRWMEEAAISHSDALGWNMERYLKLGAAFAATVHKIHYLRPTHVGDELIMNTWVETLEKTISRRAFYLTRGGKVCMNGTTEWTFINLKTGRAEEIPPEVAEAFPIVPKGDPLLRENGIRWLEIH